MEKQSLQEIEKQASQFPQQALSITVFNDRSLREANDFLLAIKTMQKRINETFGPVIKKAHQAHREAIMQKKKYEQPLLEAERIVKPQISSYLAEMERIRREAEDKARKEKEEAEETINGLDASITKMETSVPEKIKLQGTSIRKVYRFRIVDETKIPRFYLMVDMVKIGKAVNELKEQTDIPGVEVFVEEVVSSRGF